MRNRHINQRRRLFRASQRKINNRYRVYFRVVLSESIEERAIGFSAR
ncbi:hypothetical protein [Thalassotalea aquiviva]